MPQPLPCDDVRAPRAQVSHELGVDAEHAQEAIANLVTGREFSFMTAGLAPQCLWWEAVVCHPLPCR